MTAFYNEIDPYAAQWIRNLIAAGHVAPGVVDERSIEDIKPEELHEFTQCHFFAGIAVWSLALRSAGWADDRPVWSGSAPCQPFSAAGQGAGFADERHLWPAFHHLIAECRPPVVLGEQVASSHVEPWIDLVQADLEAVGYAFGGVPFPSAGVGAPHIRDRLYWVADAGSPRSEARLPASGHWEKGVSGVVDDCGSERRGHASSPIAIPDCALNGFWRGADWLSGRDGLWRPVEPGTSPLVDGDSARVGRLRAYGNAINAEAARVFIEAVMECRP